MTSAAASAEKPELMCTTVPPAKSRAPISPIHPPTPQTQCARGLYTKVAQRTMKRRKALNFIAFGKGAGDESRGDDCKHALKNHESKVGDGGAVVGAGIHADPFEPEPVQPSDDAAVIRAEGQGIAPEHPLKGDYPEDDEALHNGPEHVLAPNHAAVKEGQPRGHEHDQGRRNEDKGGIS
jgi:hypothetical protein